MSAWPRFADRILAVEPEKGLRDWLAETARADLGSPGDVVREFFAGSGVAEAISPLVQALDHVGVLTPPGIDPRAATSALLDSPYRHGLRAFRSRILARDLASHLGAEVEIEVIQGWTAPGTTSIPSVELFVADLPPHRLARVVAEEYGCHVALHLAPEHHPGGVRDVLRAWLPDALIGPHDNSAIGVSLLYVDRPAADGRRRRLEFLAPAGG